MITKKVQLQTLRLLNFKGVKDFTADFRGSNAVVAGANATGKTTLFDAFTWCLFGKDSSDRTDSGRGGFTIKTVDETGRAIEKLEHEVSATITVDGTEKTYTRKLVENWVKPRGKAEVELKGNDTHYFINGVEVKATQYSAEVAGVVEEQLFKMITNPAYFPALDWKLQRDILLSIAGGVTLEDVAAGNEEFQQVLQMLNGREFDTFKSEISYKKKTVKAELDKCPVEINAINEVKPETPNYSALQAEIEEATAALQEIDQQVADVAAANRKAFEAVEKERAAIYELKRKQQDVLNKAQDQARKDYYEAGAGRRELKAQLDAATREAMLITSSGVAFRENDLKRIGLQIDTTNAEIKALREKWQLRNAEQYQSAPDAGEITCPLYGFICTDPRAAEVKANSVQLARESFTKKQDADLKAISEEGKAKAALLKQLTAEQEKAAAALQAERDDFNKRSTETAKRVRDLKAKLEATSEPTMQEVIATELPEYVELGLQIAEKEAALSEPTAPEDTAALIESKKAHQQRIDDAKAAMAVKTIIERHAAAIQEIKAREKELAQQLADLENVEFSADKLNKARVNEVERRVNSKFEFVRFRMFEPQLNGGEVPTCVASVNGVKYADLNNAMKINAGLDIIRTLCDFHGVSAPIFIDNAESVNTVLPIASQLIRLVVTTDKTLNITTE